MNDKADTIDTLREKVERGVQIGREHLADHPDLLAIMERSYSEWENYASQLLINSVGLSAMKFRSKEQTIAFWRTMKMELASRQRPVGPVQ